MTEAAFLAEYGNVASGAFRHQLDRDIKSKNMRDFAGDLSGTFLPRELVSAFGLELVATADAAALLELLGEEYSEHTHDAAAVISGTFANGRISAASVTQHEAALSIAWSQLTAVPLGDPNGIVPLDAGAKIPAEYLPDFLLGQVSYQGTWNAATNTPAIPAASAANKGWYYVASSDVATGHGYANVPAIDFLTGDWIISNGSAWQKVDNTDAVTNFNGRLGAILPIAEDYNAFYVRHDTAAQGLNGTQQGNARTNMGLGALAVLDTVNNSNWSGTDLAVTNGGTGSSDAAGARTNLGLTGNSNTTHYHDGRYYTETEIANFFSGASAITGYNKSDWDTAFGWGDHAGLYAAISHNHAAGDITSGTFANARIAAGNVTQHQAALSIAWSQLTGVPGTFTPAAHNHAAADITSGTFANARIAAGNVTQHQAALSIAWSQLTGVPGTFTPAAHAHSAADITSGTIADARISGAYTGITNLTYSGVLIPNSTSTRDKIRVWGGSLYTIGMQHNFTYGYLNNDYAMTFQMNNSVHRGWWWGHDGHTQAQGAMSLTTDGRLYVNQLISVGGTLVSLVGHTHSAANITSGTMSYARLPISSTQVSNWDTAFGWGDHDGLYPTGSGTANYFPLWNSASVLENSVIYQNDGNIGIGTTGPAYRFQVTSPDDAWTARFQNASGYIDIGPATTGGAHIYTDRAAFFFNKDLTLVGNPSRLVADGTNEMKFKVGGADRVTIDVNGNIGINKPSPGYRVDVNGALNATSLLINGVAVSTSSDTYWTASGGTIYYNGGAVGVGTSTPTYDFEVNSSGSAWTARFQNTSGYIDIGPANSSAAHIYTDRAFLAFNVDLLLVGNPSRIKANGTNPLRFMTNNIDRVTIVSGGSVGIGTTSPSASYALDVTGTIRTTVDFVKTSDRKLKQNFRKIENPLERVLAMNGWMFDWRRSELPKNNIGFIAQEVEQCFPELVDRDENGLMGVKYANTVPVLVEAIKELHTALEAANKRIVELERRAA